jgi:mRNA interferase MazF
MRIKQYEIWLADLKSARGTEPGKTRPVVIIQTDLLNGIHPSTIICPLTTNIRPEVQLLRVHIKKGRSGRASDILVDQIRSIDKTRLLRRLGRLQRNQIQALRKNIKIVLDLAGLAGG